MLRVLLAILQKVAKQHQLADVKLVCMGYSGLFRYSSRLLHHLCSVSALAIAYQSAR